MNKEKNSPKEPALNSRASGVSPGEPEYPPGSHLDEFFRSLKPGMRRAKPSQDEMAAALASVQRLVSDADAEDGADDVAEQISAEPSIGVCSVCGHHNREGNRFCGMCGQPIHTAAAEAAVGTSKSAEPEPHAKSKHGVTDSHHYHHHYHHHYFPAGHESGPVRARVESGREVERLGPAVVARSESMTRAEATVRHLTQEWVMACNTKHLDDLLDLYVADALVLRSNCPPVRGAAALREFFFGALDAGLGDVELDPIRVEVVGDLAYEAGRCKALVPSAVGKRREDRGKYLWVFARQANGEWKLATDCWSSDLTLLLAESDITPPPAAKASARRA